MFKTEEMLKVMENAFPDRCPSVDMADRAIWIYAGKVEMLRIMRAKLEEATAKYKPEVLIKGD